MENITETAMLWSLDPPFMPISTMIENNTETAMIWSLNLPLSWNISILVQNIIWSLDPPLSFLFYMQDTTTQSFLTLDRSSSLLLYFFGGLECVGHSFAYVVHFVLLREVKIRTQRAAVASRRANNLATHFPIAYMIYYYIAGYYRADRALDSGPGGHTNNSNIHCQQEAHNTWDKTDPIFRGNKFSLWTTSLPCGTSLYSFEAYIQRVLNDL